MLQMSIRTSWFCPSLVHIPTMFSMFSISVLIFWLVILHIRESSVLMSPTVIDEMDISICPFLYICMYMSVCAYSFNSVNFAGCT